MVVFFMQKGNFIYKIKDFFSKKSYTGLITSSDLKKNKSWDGKSFLTAYEISLYTNAAIRKRAEKVGQAKFTLKKGKNEVLEHDLLNLLYKPNKFFSGFEFWSLYQTYKDLVGKVFVYVQTQKELSSSSDNIFDKKITALHLLNPELMSYEFDDTTGEITKYIYRTSKGSIEYLPNQIIYSRYPNPKNILDGMSLLRAGFNAISTETQLSEYQENILKNGGRVESVFRFKTAKLTRTQLDELKEQYKDQYAEAKKSGLPLFLGGDGEYQNLGLKPEELAYLETKKMTLDDICLLTGVPKAVLSNVTDIKYSNADASLRVFLQETVKPLIEDLTTKLNEFVINKEYELSFVDPTPDDEEMTLKKNENGIKNYYMTINEARANVGMEEIKGGDEILVPFSVMPMGQERQPADTNTQKSFKKKDFDHPLKDEFIRRKYFELRIKRADRMEEKMKGMLNKYFRDQKNRIIDKLEAQRTYRRKSVIDDIFSQKTEIKIAFDTFLPVLEKYLKEAGVDTMDFIGYEDFDFYISSDIKNWLDKKADIFSESINETTFEQLKNEFAESLEANEDRRSLINRIKETYGMIEEGRAKTIARTEVHASMQKGSFEAYKQANIPIKIWVAVMDDKTRDTHAMLDGQEVPINHVFSNGLEFPGDISGPAEEVINCRCQI